MAKPHRRWPFWKVGYFMLMGALGLIAWTIVVIGLVLIFSGSSFYLF